MQHSHITTSYTRTFRIAVIIVNNRGRVHGWPIVQTRAREVESEVAGSGVRVGIGGVAVDEQGRGRGEMWGDVGRCGEMRTSEAG